MQPAPFSATQWSQMQIKFSLCKTIEHIIASSITKHFERYSILYGLQHGFRERSCKTRLIQLVENLARNLVSDTQTDLILLDFSRAFDKVSHLKLLYKLQMHGIYIVGCTLKWIRSFLIGRTQTIVLEGEISDELSGSPGLRAGAHSVSALHKWLAWKYTFPSPLPKPLACWSYGSLPGFRETGWSPAAPEWPGPASEMGEIMGYGI